MIKNVFMCICLAGFLQVSIAQSISNQVVATNGFSASSGGSSIDFTVGDLIVKTETSAGTILTQGFQQTYIGNSSINGEQLNFRMTVYPNPTTDIVYIKMESNCFVELGAEIYDLLGNKVELTPQLSNNGIALNLESLPAASYYVHVMDKNTKQVFKTIKIQKTSNQ